VGLHNAILVTGPTSYWPLDETSGDSCHDEMDLHLALVGGGSVKLGAIPFGPSSFPYFDGEIGSYLTVAADPQYSHSYANALTVAVWICPLALDNAHTEGSTDQYVHFLEKSIESSTDVEWLMRLYNATNPNRHSRLSFYTFNLGSPARQGNGAYMEYGVSANDAVPVDLGKWLFVVGLAEPWISASDLTKGCIFWKQNARAVRSAGDKYGSYHVHPQDGAGPLRIGGTPSLGYRGSMAHLAIWNRLLSSTEITSIWTEGQAELRGTPMYHSYA
jgi:hypothetical protein